jgi:rapamycin-insensitive companion of mTOR
MKSRPEYRQVFASSAMLFRALHIISTSKYRQPVRRYILDLFDLELNGDTVAALAAWGKRLRSPDTPGVGQAQKSSRLENPRAFSIYRPRRAKDMDDESDSSDEEGMAASAPPTRKRAPVVTLRPMSRIIGFKD